MSHVRFRFFIPGLLALLVLAGAFSLATAPDAHACSCVMPPPPQEALEQSEEVFTGEVVDITSIGSGGHLRVRFAVSETWKGVQHRQVEVATPAGSAACGYEFQEGQEYLVYTQENSRGPGPETVTGLCQRNAELANAGEDLDALGEGTPGSELAAVDAGEDDSGEGESLGTSAWLIGGGATLVAFVLMALRFLRW